MPSSKLTAVRQPSSRWIRVGSIAERNERDLRAVARAAAARSVAQ